MFKSITMVGEIGGKDGNWSHTHVSFDRRGMMDTAYFVRALVKAINAMEVREIKKGIGK